MGYESTPGLDAALVGGVLTLTINRPKQRNAIDDAVTAALIGHLEAAQQDEAVRAILLTGAGDDFCSGFDLISRNTGDPNAGSSAKPRAGSIQRRLPAQAHRLLPLVVNTQVPMVCAVSGWAAGIGLHLAVAADFCVAARSARFWEPFSTRGFTPDSGGTWLLPRLVGIARAKELLMLGRELSGDEAAEWGLISSCVDDGKVATTADALAQRLASGPTVALGLTKWLVNAGGGLSLEQHLANEAFALELSSRSEDFREGIAALKEKRDPKFGGR
jgi:2-(1,2-epoxy-1,2-dihydrophenyl)acetyl-CoA isomerase